MCYLSDRITNRQTIKFIEIAKLYDYIVFATEIINDDTSNDIDHYFGNEYIDVPTS